ncbi:MAG TPA: pyridoxal-dependent decarboxylase [Woeseiaceae bacterium]|nr:pyridoxal-dependent decarboxylase [Woeseiaceae bacterium]
MPFRHQRELELLRQALDTLQAGFGGLADSASHYDLSGVADVLQETARRMQDNYPYHHPRYAGQMLKPPHPVARLAYALSLWLNPNNHALDGGRASSAMELECVAAIARMFGMREWLGHLCGGGTMANLEALWVAGQLRPGCILASRQAHYTHARLSEVLKLDFASVPVTPAGGLDLEALRGLLRTRQVGTVVATIGTTGVGAIDPLADILALKEEFDFRVHVDAAYGGYFQIAAELGDASRRHYDCIAKADSIVIDPHKHGLQPYGCGCVLFKEPGVGTLYKHDSAYTYFSSSELHLGEISLECSRPGAAAVALWATQQLLPMQRGAAFAEGLDRSLLAARKFHQWIEASENYSALMPPELDIVVYAVNAPDAVTASNRARAIFERAAQANLHLALIELPAAIVGHYRPELEVNRDTVTCLRSCLMKPEHLDWLDDICTSLDTLAERLT